MQALQSCARAVQSCARAVQEPSITANTPRLHAVEVKCRDAPLAKDKVHTVVRSFEYCRVSLARSRFMVVQPCRLNQGVERVRKALAFDPEMELMLS